MSSQTLYRKLKEFIFGSADDCADGFRFVDYRWTGDNLMVWVLPTCMDEFMDVFRWAMDPADGGMKAVLVHGGVAIDNFQNYIMDLTDEQIDELFPRYEEGGNA